MTQGPLAAAGWYPDPWFSGQHRYWTGQTWTADVFPDGPIGAVAPPVMPRPDHERPPVAPPVERATPPPPAPSFAFASPPAATAVFAPWETLESGSGERTGRRLLPWQISALALVAGIVLGFIVVDRVVVNTGHRTTALSPAPPVQPAPVPRVVPSTPASNDPSASILQGLVVRQPDVPSSSIVQLLDGGNLVVGQTTLDLCNGRYPSEDLRTARLQVVEYARDGSVPLSTEAVLYRTPADAAQAMQEVSSVAAHCPHSPVVSPVGEPTVMTHFLTRPDGSWKSTPGVERQAYAFTTSDTFGTSQQQVAVYLRRGRLLEGLYFHAPVGPQPAVNGATTVGDIVTVFEKRIAAVPGGKIGA